MEGGEKTDLRDGRETAWRSWCPVQARVGGRRGQKAVAGEAEWGEGRGVWGSHLPSDRLLGELLTLEAEDKEAAPDPSAPSFLESWGWCGSKGLWGSGLHGWHCTPVSPIYLAPWPLPTGQDAGIPPTICNIGTVRKRPLPSSMLRLQPHKAPSLCKLF